jgi:hypothetical protein
LQEVQHGLTPQDALKEVAQQLQQAGGSFKKLQQQLACRAAQPAATDKPSMSNTSADAACHKERDSSNKKQLKAHPLLNVEPLTLAEADDALVSLK